MPIITVGRVGRNQFNRTNVRIDRTTVLGNPFYKGTRDENCDKYQAYFEREMLKKGSPIHKEVTRLYKLAKSGQKLNLQCWCAPKRCHGDTIKKFIESYL